jgi:RNA polymerase sigma-70 factor (family 1)
MNLCESSNFTSVFHKYAKSLRNFLYYKYGDEAAAEDIVQEAYIKLWQNCSQVSLDKAKSYLYTVANNLSLNRVAHQKVKLNYAIQNVQKTTTIESPEYIVEEEQFKSKLLEAIDSLNETQRVAFLMHRIDGKKYAEIAEELHISVKAVEKRIHLALIALKSKIDGI